MRYITFGPHSVSVRLSCGCQRRSQQTPPKSAWRTLPVELSGRWRWRQNKYLKFDAMRELPENSYNDTRQEKNIERKIKKKNTFEKRFFKWLYIYLKGLVTNDVIVYFGQFCTNHPTLPQSFTTFHANEFSFVNNISFFLLSSVYFSADTCLFVAYSEKS